jgi:hypothetical protein
VGLERGPLSLLSTIEELLDRKVAALVYKAENTSVGIRCVDQATPSIRKIGCNFAENCGRPVGIVRTRTKATEVFN